MLATFVRHDDRLGERVLDLVVGEAERAGDLGHLLHELEVRQVFLRVYGALARMRKRENPDVDAPRAC